MVLFLAVGWPLAWYFLAAWAFLPDDAGRYALGSNAVSYGLFGAFTVTVAVFAGEFARDLAGERYRKFRSMPIAPTADLLGRFCAGVVLASVSYGTVIAVASVHGARFQPRPGALLFVPLTLVTFCLLALALALVLATAIPKPEHMTALGIVTVLIAYYVTGFNGLVPGIIADDPTYVNYVPNSLASRMHIYYMFDGDLAGPETPFTPPELPVGPEYVALLVGYAVALLGVAVALNRLVAYGGD